MPRKGSVDEVSKIVGKILIKLEKKQVSREGQVFSHWEQIVGKNISEHVVPEKIYKKKLFLKVDSSSWLFEIKNRRKEEILRKINGVFKEKIIEDIVLKVDSIADSVEQY